MPPNKHQSTNRQILTRRQDVFVQTQFAWQDDMTDIDAIIIGAGVIALQSPVNCRCVVVRSSFSKARMNLARQPHRATVRSSTRPYYPPGSLKAKLCVEGKERLYDSAGRTASRIAVAVSTSSLQPIDETPLLTALREKGIANGCDDLRLIEATARPCTRIQPCICVSALLSPSTGIIDSHGLCWRAR